MACRGFALALGSLMTSMSLQGCFDMDLAHVEGYFPFMPGSNLAIHKVSVWRQFEDAYSANSYIVPNSKSATKPLGTSAFNSCRDKGVSSQNVCGTHGVCAPFDKTEVTHPVFFCKCDLGWAGNECTIQAKSQRTAWLLSLLFGWLGLDEYYLEFNVGFVLKVFGLTMGLSCYLLEYTHIGMLIVLSYWFFDIVRIGSGAVHTHGFPKHKVAADLPHWAFAFSTILFFAFIGLCIGICKTYWKIKAKRRTNDLEINYNACDQYGATNHAKLSKPKGCEGDPMTFGFPVPFSNTSSYDYSPKYFEHGEIRAYVC